MTNAEFGIEPTPTSEVVEGLRREREGLNPGSLTFLLMTLAADRLEAAEKRIEELQKLARWAERAKKTEEVAK